MRLETLPIVLGILLGLLALALVVDAWTPDESVPTGERRRRFRRPRDRFGEALLGLGVGAVSAVLLAGEAWRYSVVSVIVAAVLLAWGVKRNAGYLKGTVTRGDVSKPASRQGPPSPLRSR